MDIERYTASRLEDKVFQSCDLRLRKEFQDYILATADGVFLWVRLVMDELERKARSGASENSLNSLLKRLPKDLQSFYEHIWNELKGSRDADELSQGGRILEFCLYSHRAIELVELRDALALLEHNERGDEPDHGLWVRSRPTDIRGCLTYCVGGLVDTKNNRIELAVAQLMHQTVREFLQNPPRSMVGTPFDINNPGGVSPMISLACVQFLEIVCEELKPGGLDDPACIKYLDERPLLKYSLQYLMQNRDSIDSKTEARLKGLIERLKGVDGSRAHILLWRLTESKLSGATREALGSLLLHAAKGRHVMALGNLLAAGANARVSERDMEENQALHLAASGGHNAAAMVLLDGGANIDCGNANHATPLFLAARAGNLRTMDLLLSYGACEYSDRSGRRDGRSLLQYAATGGHIEAVQRSLELEMGEQDEELYHSLNHAVLGGHDGAVDILAKLIVQRTGHLDIWEKHHYSQLSLLDLAVIGGHESTVEKLLGMAPKAKDTNYNECVDLARVYGNGSVEGLLEKLGGAATEPSDSSCQGGENVHTIGTEESEIAKLHIAAVYDDTQVIYWLLVKGIHIDSRDENGCTALHLAAQNNSSAVNSLLCRDADVLALDKSGKTPLHAAVEECHEDTRALRPIVRKCRNSDLDADIPADSNGETPLHYAAKCGWKEGCELLLDLMHDQLEATDKNGSTALHMAAMWGHLGVCTLLLDSGADRSAVNRNWSTPSDAALDAGFQELASLLLSLDEDSPTDTDSGGSDPPYAYPVADTEKPRDPTPPPPFVPEKGAPTALNLFAERNSRGFSSEPMLEKECETKTLDVALCSAGLSGELTSVIRADDEHESAELPASRKRHVDFTVQVELKRSRQR